MRILIAGLIGAVLLSPGFGAVAANAPGAAGAGSDAGRWGWLPGARDFEPITHERYVSECGGCHFAYPPGMLPAEAWQRIMAALDEHFGDDATLDPAIVAELGAYLSAEAANATRSIRSRAFAAAPIGGEGPVRITETRYFHRHHDLIPARLVKDNPEVGSFSNCQKCHPGAEQGVFNPSSVEIPGAGMSP